MRNEKANIIRGILLNKINNEILLKLKKKDQMRINGKKEEELYEMNCGNFEVFIIHKPTTGNSMNNICEIRNASTINLDITSSLKNDKQLENIFEGKSVISEKKLKIVPKIKPKKKEKFFQNEKKRAKDGFFKLRKIVRNLINKFQIIPKSNISKDNFENNKIIKTKKRASFPSKNESEFKIQLINISHREPAHHYKLENNDVNKKKKKIDLRSSKLFNIRNHKIIKSYRKSILIKNKLDLSKILNTSNNEDNKKKTSLTLKTKNTSQLMLLYNENS